MARLSENRFVFSQSNLSLLERSINAGQYERETFVYDTKSSLALRIRPSQLFTECVFSLYKRIKVNGIGKGSIYKRNIIKVNGIGKGSIYKRNIIKVSEARNLKIPVSELRAKADSLVLEIQKGNDPVKVAKEKAMAIEAERGLKSAKRNVKKMVYGTPDNRQDCFIFERTPAKSYRVDIDYTFESLLPELLDEPLYSITPEYVKNLYLEKLPRGKTQLHNAMRILRSVWNWAETKYDDTELFIRNPVSRAMKQLNVNINKTNCLKNRLHDQDFTAYINGVLKLKQYDHTSAFRNSRDALLFILFSGVRRTAAVSIETRKLDLERGIFKIINKGGMELELPLNSYTRAIVENRLKNLPVDSQYLFPGIGGGSHYRDTTDARSIVKELSGIYMTNHDLRRTYKSIAIELHLNPMIVDDLLGHTRGGVNAHYVHPSIAALREVSQKICDYMVNASHINVVKELTRSW